MHAWISCIGVSHLSSMVLGVLLGCILRSTGACAVSFVAVHGFVLWFDVLFNYVCECAYKRDLSAHAERNSAFLTQTAATSAPRHVIPGTSVRGNLALATLGGVFDGLAVTLVPAKGGDSYALALSAVALCAPRTRWMPGIALVYIMLTVAVPGVHGVLRAMCMLIGAVLCHGYTQLRWRCLRVLVGTCVVASSQNTCASKGMPPVIFLALGLYRLRANPVLVLTFASLVTL